MEGFSPAKAAALAVVLAIAFTAMFVPPAEAGRRGSCDFPVERFYGKAFVKNSGCTTEGLAEMTAITNGIRLYELIAATNAFFPETESRQIRRSA